MAKPLRTLPMIATDKSQAAFAEESDVPEKAMAVRQSEDRSITSRKITSSTSTGRITSCGVVERKEVMSSSFDFLTRNIQSDEEEDAESTILGHHNNVLPLPTSTTPNSSDVRHHDAPRRSVVSNSSRSSITSSSNQSRSLIKDCDIHSADVIDAAHDASNPSSRRTSGHLDLNRQSVASNLERPRTGGSLRSVSSLRSLRPLCPPPDMPLPPKPIGSPRSISRNSGLWRLSDASARTTVSISPDPRASLQRRAASSRLSGSSSRSHARADSSDMSASELDSIRHISYSFPSPVSAVPVSPPSSKGHVPTQRLSRSSAKTRASIGSSDNPRIVQTSRRPHAARGLDQRQPSASSRASRQNKDEFRSIEEQESGGEASDSALSDVLDLTDNHGVLSVTNEAGPPAASRTRVPRVVLRVESGSPSSSPNSSPYFEKGSVEAATDTRDNSQIRSKLDHATGLVAALKLQADVHTSKDEISPSTKGGMAESGDRVQKQSSILTDSTARSAPLTAPLTSTDSMPSLASASSLELSYGSQRRLSGDSSFPCSSSGRSRESSSLVELNSIYDAYRNSNATMASRFTAPIVRIEGPEGDEMSDSEMDESSVDAPRKRTKQDRRNRRKTLGFDEQRAPIRSGSAASRTLRPGQIFSPSLQTPSENPSETALLASDPYAFYEFSPSLPPFVPSGLSPRDLTGTGTWSSIVARASEKMNSSRQPSVASLSSLTSRGPVSMRDIKAAAKVRQQQAEAARRARESLSTHVSSLSYRPFAIHDHALSVANRRTSSPHSWMGYDPSNTTELASSSGHGYADSSVSELASRWPIAVGSNQAVGSQDVILFNDSILSRQPNSQGKVYVEFCMQTSPKSSPTSGNTELADISPQDEPLRVGSEAETGNSTERLKKDSRKPVSRLNVAFRPPIRRKSAVSLIEASKPDLDEAGVWPLKVRAPRLSSAKSLYNLRRTDRQSSGSFASVVDKGTADDRLRGDRQADFASREEEDSEESDLDVETNLEDLAERSGVLDESRGAKRKLGVANNGDVADSGFVERRKIASIPARSHRISAALERIQSARASRSAEWLSSEDEDEGGPTDSKSSKVSRTPRFALKARASSQEPGSAPAKMSRAYPAYHRSVSWTMSDRRGSESCISRARSASPDLGVLLNQSDEEEVLLTADVDAEGLKTSNGEWLDDQFDAMVGNNLKSRFAASVSNNQSADELLSSNGHSIGHSSGHDTVISDTGGTSGHDPQRPNQVLAEIVRRRLDLKMQNIMSDASSTAALSSGLPEPCSSQAHSTSLPLATPTHDTASCQGDMESTDLLENSTRSPIMQDTPSTIAGSEIWTSFQADRSSTMSTATTYSVRSADDSAHYDDDSKHSREDIGADLPVHNQDKGADPAGSMAGLAAAEPLIKSDSTMSSGSNHRSSLPRRKSSGLPMYTSKIAKPKSKAVDPTPVDESQQGTDNIVNGSRTPQPRRPSLPQTKVITPSRSQHRISDQTGSSASQQSLQPRTIRRYQSLANLQRTKGLTLSVSSEEKQGSDSLKVPLASTPNASTTSAKSIASPSKLPSLRTTPSKIGLSREATSDTMLPRRVTSPNSSSVSPKTATLREPVSPQPSGLPSAVSRIPKPT